MLAKSLRPLPEKWHGLADQETRYRQRYVDLIVNPHSREVFLTRSRIVTHLRNFLTQKGFLEVETPMMQPIPGGATARPFKTHHNALDMDLYLRVAPELYLKRLLVGGFERVFEINRNFRNEGLSTQHNPEFTMLEFYQAYATYRDLIEITEAMFGSLVKEIKGGLQFEYQGKTLDFTPPWQRLTLKESLLQYRRVKRGGAPGSGKGGELCQAAGNGTQGRRTPGETLGGDLRNGRGTPSDSTDVHYGISDRGLSPGAQERSGIPGWWIGLSSISSGGRSPTPSPS